MIALVAWSVLHVIIALQRAGLAMSLVTSVPAGQSKRPIMLQGMAMIASRSVVVGEAVYIGLVRQRVLRRGINRRANVTRHNGEQTSKVTAARPSSDVGMQQEANNNDR